SRRTGSCWNPMMTRADSRTVPEPGSSTVVPPENARIASANTPSPGLDMGCATVARSALAAALARTAAHKPAIKIPYCRRITAPRASGCLLLHRVESPLAAFRRVPLLLAGEGVVQRHALGDDVDRGVEVLVERRGLGLYELLHLLARPFSEHRQGLLISSAFAGNVIRMGHAARQAQFRHARVQLRGAPGGGLVRSTDAVLRGNRVGASGDGSHHDRRKCDALEA